MRGVLLGASEAAGADGFQEVPGVRRGGRHSPVEAGAQDDVQRVWQNRLGDLMRKNDMDRIRERARYYERLAKELAEQAEAARASAGHYRALLAGPGCL
jgi:hypothetical protein